MNRLLAHVPGGSLTIKGLVSEAATATIEGVSATVTTQGEFRATIPAVGGLNTFAVVATDPSGTVRSPLFEVAVTGDARTYTDDANGNT